MGQVENILFTELSIDGLGNSDSNSSRIKDGDEVGAGEQNLQVMQISEA